MKQFFLAGIAAVSVACSAQAAVIDAFDIDVTGPAGTNSAISLILGKVYTITVSGAFQLAFSDTRLADAEYYELSGSLIPTDIRPGTGEDIGVTINGAGVFWGAYNPLHVYSVSFTGTGSTVNLAFLDIAGGYGDNVGSLSAEISAVPLPASAPLILAGLGALAALRRRRRA